MNTLKCQAKQESKAMYLKQVKHGTIFFYSNRNDGKWQGERLFIKVKPTGFLLNSNLIADVLNRNDCLCVSLNEPFTIAAKQGNELVFICEASLNVES